MSDDGAYAIVVIALLGNPFSPRRMSKGAGAAALEHCALNVAVYGPRARAWALHERPVAATHRTENGVQIGKSVVRWDDGVLVADVDERCSPLGGTIRGRVVLRPETSTGLELPIDMDGEHRWWLVAPRARIEVDLAEPGVRFRGDGYHDANAGSAPLESAFARWTWSRAITRDESLVTYDVVEAGGARTTLGLRVRPSGDVEALEDARSAPLPRTAWGLERTSRADEGCSPRALRSLEDGPFYARGLVATRLGGRDVVAVHETLDAERLRRRWVRFLAGFRMRTSP